MLAASSLSQPCLSSQIRALVAFSRQTRFRNHSLDLVSRRRLRPRSAITQKRLQTSTSNLSANDDTNAVPRHGPLALSETGADDTGLPRSTIDLEEVVRKTRQKFGDNLPEGTLDQDEYKIYERLYGPPLRFTSSEESNTPLDSQEENHDGEEIPNALLKEGTDGQLEEVELDPAVLEVDADEEHDTLGNGQLTSGELRDMDNSLESDIRAALAQEQVEDTDDPESSQFVEATIDKELDDYPAGEAVRAHPLTFAGRFSTSPSSVSLPSDALAAPIATLLSSHPNKHLREVATRVFGGPDLPYSPLKPQTYKQLPQKPITVDAAQDKMSDMEADLYMAAVMPPVYASIMGILVEIRKRLGGEWLEGLLRKEAGSRILDAGGGGVGIIAVREMLRAEWERLKDAEADSGDLPATPPTGKAVVLTGSSALRHRASALLENTTFVPRLPDYLHASDDSGSKKPFDIVIAPHTIWPIQDDYRRKIRVQNYWSLLSPSAGVLVLLEKGNPRGFEVVAGARKMLLNNHIASPGTITPDDSELESSNLLSQTKKEPGMIIAPCTNHSTCPLYKSEGVSKGRKDFCHFEQRFVRPPYLQNIMGARASNHDDVPFSYIAVQRGRDLRSSASQDLGSGAVVQGDIATEAAFIGHQDAVPVGTTLTSTQQTAQSSPFQGEETNLASPSSDHAAPSTEPSTQVPSPTTGSPTSQISPLTLPRLIVPPLKRKGHIILDLCTPSGTFERWTVPRSHGKQAFRDARKSNWGDLWALGGKTRRPRNVKMGEGDDAEGKKKSKGKRRR